MNELQIILTTFSSEADAEIVVRQSLEERLIACGTLITGARSLYHWKGAIEDATEVMVVFKTDQDSAARCMERLSALHPYEVPEIVALNSEAASAPYAAWIKDALRITDSTLG